MTLMAKKAKTSTSRRVTKLRPASRRSSKPSPARSKTQVTLLSGGNPQIPMGFGNEPVQAYLDAMPEWKRKVGVRLDQLIEATVPGVCKAVKWNSPFYGLQEGLWFLSFHCFTHFVRVTFFQGSALDPLPSGTSKVQEVRYLDIKQEPPLDEAQFIAWVGQASRLPGTRL